MSNETEVMTLDLTETAQAVPNATEQLQQLFAGITAGLSEFEKPYAAIMYAAQSGVTKELTIEAKRLRLDIAKVRIETEKARKDEKADIVRKGKAIDGLANVIKNHVAEKESRLKAIEEHFEREEQARLEKLQSRRAETLSQYVEDAHERDLSSMDDDVWAAYLSTKKKEHKDRIEAERKAEAERKEAERKAALLQRREREARTYGDHFDWNQLDANTSEKDFKALIQAAADKKAEVEAEQERMRQELEAEKKRAEAERKKQEAAEKKRQAELEADRKRQAEIEAKRQAELEAERKKQEELQAQIEAQAEAERKAKAEAEAERKRKEAAPDKEKLLASIEAVELELYSLNSDKATAVQSALAEKLNGWKAWARKQVDSI